MKPRTKVLVSFIFIVFLVSGLYVFTDWFSRVTGYFGGEAQTEKLVNCLNSKGVQVYVSLYCPDCEKQRNDFGKHWKGLTIIECGDKKELCPNLRSVPAWYLGKTIHYGYKNFTDLQKLSGCVDE